MVETMDLRPKSAPFNYEKKITFNDTEFYFSTKPLIVTQTMDIPDDLLIFDDETDDEEEMIKSSWHHRALLGDENRKIYDDGQDTDFEYLEEMEAFLEDDSEDDYYNDL